VKPYHPHSHNEHRRKTTMVLVLLALIAVAGFAVAMVVTEDSGGIGRPPAERPDANGLPQ
jgi:hypothetical protein